MDTFIQNGLADSIKNHYCEPYIESDGRSLSQIPCAHKPRIVGSIRVGQGEVLNALLAINSGYEFSNVSNGEFSVTIHIAFDGRLCKDAAHTKKAKDKHRD